VNQVIKFPDLRPPKSQNPPALGLPAPSQYRLSSPAILASEALRKTKPAGRRRLFLLFGVAVALHAALFLGIWLTPPLRLKWSPSPDAWVQVVSVPLKAPDAPSIAPRQVVDPDAAKTRMNKTTKADTTKADTAKAEASKAQTNKGKPVGRVAGDPVSAGQAR
jgi:hypothetical protein